MSFYHLIKVSDDADRPEEVRIKVSLPRENPVVPSVYWIWKAADWQERESYDMYGIVYEGHPNLKRLLMPEGLDRLAPAEGLRFSRLLRTARRLLKQVPAQSQEFPLEGKLHFWTCTGLKSSIYHKRDWLRSIPFNYVRYFHLKEWLLFLALGKSQAVLLCIAIHKAHKAVPIFYTFHHINCFYNRQAPR